jgi:hypothetical protein
MSASVAGLPCSFPAWGKRLMVALARLYDNEDHTPSFFKCVWDNCKNRLQEPSI